MKKFLLLILLLPFFSFKKTFNESDVFFGDSITLGNELWPQMTERWTTKYTQEVNTDEYNYGTSGATMTPNTGHPTFNIDNVPDYNSTDRNIFISYWGNDYVAGVTPSAYAAATAAAVDGIIAKGWPAEKIVLCFNYLPESPGTWVNMTDSVARQWLSALRSVQQAKHTSFLDFYTPIFNRPDKASYSNDLVHPTPEWNTVMKDLAVTNIERPSATLPATLIGFSGQRRSNANELNWTVAQEQNVQTYTIERSEDGSSWNNIGHVNSQGNTAVQRSYTFTDNGIAGTKELYRLRIIDRNGQSKLSSIVMIAGTRSTTLMLSGLFPNPAFDKVNLLIDAPAKDNVTVEVIDMMGRIVSVQHQSVAAGTNSIDINVQKIHAGTYFAKVVSETNSIMASTKFIKE